ncbi:UNVERIFIED_CONTAM: Microtubule-binding protein TANGLED [Sesamum radiatum]|uniref:Microtubule-binding protein TANGLED n=1 Tax=Sesamum radiatum TaxID=300843 RepID=A0AAW2U8Z1_SESRA
MVARSPPKQQRKTAVVVAPPPLSPTLLRETVKKVDKCMARLQELQHTVTGGRKVVSGVSLSPRSSRGYLRTSLRCKQESLRIKNANSRRSPTGKLPICAVPEEWQRMSLPAMLLGETMGEILQASQFARNIVDAVSSKARKPATDDPKTPLAENRKQRSPSLENSGLQARRRREKQVVLQTIRSESNMPSLQRAKSRINFKGSSPVQNGIRECDKENCRNRQTPHKFLVKSPPAAASKFQVKIKSPPLSISPTRAAKKSPKAASSAAAKLRRSFSPSRLANRLVSPLKSRKSVQKNEGVKIMSGLKQRPMSFSIRFSPRRV